MSMLLDSLGGATRSVPESVEEEEWKRQKLVPESDSDSDSDSVTPPWRLKPSKDLKESDFYIYDNDRHPVAFFHQSFTYMNKAYAEKDKAREKALAEFEERTRNLSRSAWDAVPVPSILGLCGGIRPYTITDDRRPSLIDLSNLALNKYNADNQGANFVFDDLVKATKVVAGYTFYITFKAKDASNNSAAPQTFLAKVTDKPIDAKLEVNLIILKPTEEEPNTP